MTVHKMAARVAALLLTALGLSLGHVIPAAAQACAPNTCCATNPTTGAPACGAAAGNPLNVMSGNKFQREEDMPALPGVLGLELVRYYNSESSLSDERGIVGRGWRLSYEAELVVQPGGNSITVHQGDGTQSRYFKSLAQPDAAATLYNGTQPGAGMLAKRAAPGSRQGTQYILSPAGQGNQQTFDAQGKLVQITAPTGEYVSMQRDAAGYLLRVTDPQGRYLALGYLPAREVPAADKFRGVQHIDSPVGRFAYTYGSAAPQGSKAEPRELMANLVKVSLPTHYDPSKPANAAGGSADRGVSSSSVSKSYHYEDARHPTLLTGISVQGQGSDAQPMNQRLVTWGYDARGRANLSVKGSYDPKQAGAEQVTLAFRHKASDGSGTTVLTNSLGQTTRYSYAQINGQPQLLEVRGAGCATCGPLNVQNRYDSRGRQTHQVQLDLQGQPIAAQVTEYDGADRPIRISAISYRNGKPGPLKLQVRYEYGADPLNRLPLLIARPSVVAGKEHTIRVTYNDRGQPLIVTESGFSPLDEKGQPTSDGTPISRTTTNSYALINNRSVLVQIDGPLKNGAKGTPEDSDITTLRYDVRGDYLVGITQPGGYQSTVSYDRAGRIDKVQNAEGFQTSFSFDADKLVQTSSVGPGWTKPNVQSFKYDASGHVTETGNGNEVDKTYQAQLRQAFDSAGRTQWTASALGVLTQNAYDTESRLTQTGRYSNSVALQENYAYDSQSRMVAAWSNAGAAYHLGYNDRGGLERVSDALGRETGRAAVRASDDKSPRARKWFDDFGRIVATVSPDSGLTTRRFDEADRMTGSVDAQGNTAAYAYDAQGRIQRQTIKDAATGQSTLTTWTYEGRRLIALDHPVQSERYQYDKRGLKTEKIVTLKPSSIGNKGAITTVTHYRYDDAGQLQSTSLPDGSQLRYERNGQGQVVALQRSLLQTRWLQDYAAWLLPAQTVVKNLERDLVGLKSFTTGNGIQAQYQRSREGALARVVYRNTNDVRSAKLQTAANSTSPLPLGGSAEQAIAALLGVGAAHAAEPAQEAKTKGIATAPAGALPGALGLPSDPKALIDHRYLWDAQGNLIYSQAKAGVESRTGYGYDGQDRLIMVNQRQPAAVATPVSATAKEANNAAGGSNTSRYYYQQGRRVLSQEGVTDSADLKTNTRRARYQAGSHRWVSDSDSAGPAQYNANGQPEKAGSREYVWDTLGRLVEVRQENKSLARYSYNHRGERVGKNVAPADRQLVEGRSTSYLYEAGLLTAELDSQGRVTREYLYMADQPIAVIEAPEGMALSQMELSDLEKLGADARHIFKQLWQGLIRTDSGEQMVWLHINHLGAPEAATDAAGQLVWQVSYAPFGAAKIITASRAGASDTKSGFELNLRLPGQYADRETGLHYNKHRYYDPGRGEYLSADPLGTPDGPNGYAYVRYNPLKYVDPEGLVLFAFDGTGNDESNPATLSNVVRFRDAYNNGESFYITGPATKDPKTGIAPSSLDLGGVLDTTDAYTGPARIAAMIKNLDEYSDSVDDQSAFDIDVTGFSRGAAEARDFANKIAQNFKNGYYQYKNSKGESRCQKVNLRFMGLFDSVLSTHTGSYQLQIPDAFQYVAHAVALNEYRGGAIAFPSESILGLPTPSGSTRIERGFLGAHSDIGGGFPVQDLAKVAMAWMVDQAKTAGVKLDVATQTIIANPVLHDKSSNLLFGAPSGGPTVTSEDRDVRYADGTVVKQRKTTAELMTYADTLRFITYKPSPNSSDGISGTVDAKAYIEWLNKHDYNINITVQ